MRGTVLVERSRTNLLVRGAALLCLTVWVTAASAQPGPPVVSTDVYSKAEAPISGPPAPRFTREDYPSSGFPGPLGESRVAIWLLAQQHLYFGAFVLGALWLVTLAETVSTLVRDRSRAARYREAGREILRLVVVALSAAAVLGGLLVAGLFAWYPGLSHYLATVFRPGVLFYAVLFITFTATTLLYYYRWPHRDSNVREWDHLGVGVFASLLGLALMLVTNSWGSFMMSPAGVDAQGRYLGSAWAVFRNALSLPLAVHRVAGHVVFASAVIAAYAAYHALTAARDDRKAYYDWMGGIALLAGIAAFFTIPFGGYWLSREIYAFRQQMGITLFGGLIAWLGIILVSLVALLIAVINVYVWQRIGAEPGGDRFRPHAKYVFFVLAACTLVYITPHTMVMRAAELETIGGQQHPVIGNFGVESAKQPAIHLMLLATTWSLLTWRRARGETPGSPVPANLAALFIAGGANLVWLGTMGYFIPANVRVGLSVPMVMTMISVVAIGARLVFLRTPRVSPPAWGRLSPRGYWALLVLAVTVTWLMGLAGYRRSAVRLFWHVTDIVRDQSPWAFTHAIGFAANVITVNTLLFWLGLLGVVWLARRGVRWSGPTGG